MAMDCSLPVAQVPQLPGQSLPSYTIYIYYLRSPITLRTSPPPHLSHHLLHPSRAGRAGQGLRRPSLKKPGPSTRNPRLPPSPGCGSCGALLEETSAQLTESKATIIAWKRDLRRPSLKKPAPSKRNPRLPPSPGSFRRVKRPRRRQQEYRFFGTDFARRGPLFVGILRIEKRGTGDLSQPHCTGAWC